LRMQSGRAERDLIKRVAGGYPPTDGRRHSAAPGSRLDPTGPLIIVVGCVERLRRLSPVGEKIHGHALIRRILGELPRKKARKYGHLRQIKPVSSIAGNQHSCAGFVYGTTKFL
jgi:hypothetical protein